MTSESLFLRQLSMGKYRNSIHSLFEFNFQLLLQIIHL